MDRRLVPVNAVLALLRNEPGWPSDLAEQGLRLHALEAEVQSDPGVVRADVICVRTNPDLVLLCECKSGHHVDPRQARSYLNAEWKGLRYTGAAPSGMPSETPVATIFVGLDEHRGALQESLMREQIDAPLLTVGASGARLTGSAAIRGLHDFERKDKRYGLPPIRLRVDHESPMDEIAELLIQQVAVALARGEAVLDLDQAAHGILPEWPLVGAQARRAFTGRLKEAAQRLERGGLRGDVRFEPETNTMRARLALLSQPAQADPRGMPQAWQALARRAAEAMGRSRRPLHEDQLSFDDLDEKAGAP